MANTNDSLLDQVFPGEQCRIYVGSKGESTLSEYSAYITNFKQAGFENQYKTDRTMGTYIGNREGLSNGTVSFEVILMGSDLPKIRNMDTSNPATGYTQYSLTTDDKLFKVKLEFTEETDGLPGSPISSSTTAFKQVYYNARGMRFDSMLDSESYLKGNFVFTVPPFNDTGSPNYYELEKNAGTSLTAWGSVESVWDTQVGW